MVESEINWLEALRVGNGNKSAVSAMRKILFDGLRVAL